MASLHLYYLTQLKTTVSLLPEQINYSLESHLLTNLKSKLEGKTIDNGIVMRIYRLIEYNNGLIDKINFMGIVVFTVVYECLLCAPIKDLEIVCLVENDIKGYLIARNGPVVVAIRHNNVDLNRFEINNSTIVHKQTTITVSKGSYLKVTIISINKNAGEKTILTACRLNNIATEEEIASFNNDQALATNRNPSNEIQFI